jgi:transposase InsO family protein
MKQAYPKIGVEGLCRLFGVTRQAHYKYVRKEKKSLIEAEVIIKMAEQVRKIHPRIGGRKMLILLEPRFKEHGIKMGRDAFFELLSMYGMLIRPRKRKWLTTWSRHRFRKYKNLVKEMNVERVNQVWVGDITYLKTKKGHLYLSFITDAYSRKVVGYDVADNLGSVNALHALKMAINSLPGGAVNLIHHSDRGVQYCCNEYVEELNQRGVRISMTENGDPLENAIAERVNGIVKNEYLVFKPIINKEQAKEILKEAVTVYNQLRPHMSIGYKTPEEVHLNNLQVNKSWKSYYNKNKV